MTTCEHRTGAEDSSGYKADVVLAATQGATAEEELNKLLESFPDTRRFLRLLEHLDDDSSMKSMASNPPESAPIELSGVDQAKGLFAREEEVVVARAPGRLDVMGGIADYSGALVLQMPIQEACHVAVQRLPAGKARHSGQGAGSGREGPPPPPSSSTPPPQPFLNPTLRIVSLTSDPSHRSSLFQIDLSELEPGGHLITYPQARALFERDPSTSWAAYVAGALVVLMRECGVRLGRELSLLVQSDVPEGKGVSSSAAVEVAAMSALAAAHGVDLGARQLALLCQKVENLVVGAPCGVMDQMTAALGRRGELLALRCQPAEVQGTVQIPPGMRFWGVDSGVRHSVGGSDYGAVRAGAFMGLRILSQAASGEGAGGGSGGGAGTVEGEGSGRQGAQPIGGGYLANVSPSQLLERYERHLPEEMGGRDFLDTYGDHWDTATRVEAGRVYAVQQPASHPILENFRVQAFRQILVAHPPPSAHSTGSTSLREQVEVLGELMYQSHASYSRCGLGCPGTDRLVQLVREEHDRAEAQGRPPALFGAKITGGGSGGTVCILGVGSAEGEAAVQRVVLRYAAETGHVPAVFRDSSSGAASFQHVRLRPGRGVAG